MFNVLFLLFVIVPIIEITVLINVGSILGVGPTIAIVILTAWLGAKKVKQQGIATLNSVQTKMAQGQMPSDEIVAGMMLLVAGVFLVTPGFVTDILGLSLLVPSVRQRIIKVVQKHIVVSQQKTQSQFHAHSSFEHEHQSFTEINETKVTSHHKGQTLDGEFERKD